MKRRCLVLLVGVLPWSAFAQQGTWEQAFPFGPDGGPFTRAIHLVHVWNGSTSKFLALGDEPPLPDSRLWTPPSVGDPSSGVFENHSDDPGYMFCGGHSLLANGLVLHVGGFYVNDADLFNPWAPAGDQWNSPIDPPDMTYDRYYPTATTLGDGRVLVCAGHQDDGGPHATIPELYDPASNAWTLLHSAQRQQPLYPYMFVLPQAGLIDAGPGQTRLLNPSTWMWGATIGNPTWPDPPPPPPGDHGSAVMYAPGRIIRCGGDNPAVATTWKLSIPGNAIPATWIVAANMNIARRNHNLVVMPDGRVLALGGNTVDNNIGPVFEAEIFDPASGTWTLQPPSDPFEERWYHSTAVLLPDARVVSAGGNGNPTAQIFNPPYITSGAPRPIITAAPTYMQYGQPYAITFNPNGGPQATDACLIRLAAVTHGFDQDQRRVPLTVSAFGMNQVTVTAPANGNIAPPGYYMLFILSEYAAGQFAPCTMARYVQVGS